MAYDDALYFYEGARSGSIKTTAFSGDFIKVAETPVHGLELNVVIPQVESTGNDGLSIVVYENDTGSWDGTEVEVKTIPTLKTAGSYRHRIHSLKDYLATHATIISVAEDSKSCDFGAVDIRLGDWMTKYAGS